MKKKYLLALALLVTTVSILIYLPLVRLPLHTHIDYNEGWNAYHAIESRHSNIYGNKLTPVNYPPLSFYIFGLFSDPLFAGRITSLISFIITSVFVSIIVYKHKKDILASLVAGVCTLGIFLGISQSYVGMNDPQILAHVFMLAAFLSYLSKQNIFLTTFLITVSLFIKHNILAIPAAIFLDLLIRDRKQLLSYITSLTFFCLIGVVLSQFISNNLFIPSMVLKREYSLRNAAYLIKTGILPIVLLLPLVYKFKKINIFFYYFIFSLIIGFFFSVGVGTDLNIYFDFYFSLVILAGILITEKKKIIYLILLQIFILLVFRFFQNTLFTPVIQQEKQVLQEINYLKSVPGNALCEHIELCYFAGKQFIYDPYFVYEAVKTKSMNESDTIALLDKQTFSVVQINSPLSSNQGRFTAGFYTTLRKKYVLHQNFYLPLTENKN